MTKFPAAALAASLSLCAAPALAQGLSFSGGMTVTSNYMSRGVTQSMDRPALQFWGEVENMGFYAGVWASSVRLGTDRAEIDLYAGYRFSVGAASFDVGYVRYLYDRSGDCCGEVYGTFEFEADSTTFFGGLYLEGRRGLGVNDAHLGFRYGFYDNFNASAMVGRATGGVNYGVLGLGYTVNDNVGFEAGYHFTNAQRNQFVVSSNISF
jgi:uncharacterized protein (TIGR02001 family)